MLNMDSDFNFSWAYPSYHCEESGPQQTDGWYQENPNSFNPYDSWNHNPYLFEPPTSYVYLSPNSDEIHDFGGISNTQPITLTCVEQRIEALARSCNLTLSPHMSLEEKLDALENLRRQQSIESLISQLQMQTLTDSRTDHTDELRENIFGDGPMIENQFGIQYENHYEDNGVVNGYEMHDFEEASPYTSNLEIEIEKFRLMFEAEFDHNTTTLDSVISDVVEKDRNIVDTPNDMNDHSFDDGSSCDLSCGQFDENIDNMNNFDLDDMANIFEEPHHFYPYEPQLCPSIDPPLECEIPEYFEHEESMDFDEKNSPDFVVPHLFDTYTLSGLLWQTEEKIRTLIEKLSWSHYTPELPTESLFENSAQKSPPPLFHLMWTF